MTENADAQRVVILKRLFERKDVILQASHELEDLRSQYRSKGSQDIDGTIEAEARKRIYTIISCLGELTMHTEAKSGNLVNVLVEFVSKLAQLEELGEKEKQEGKEGGHMHLLDYTAVTALCAVANSIRVEWKTDGKTLARIDKLSINLIENLLKPV